MSDLMDTFNELSKFVNPNAWSDCRLCGNIVLSDGVESPPLGPICLGCLIVEAKRLAIVNAELLAACEFARDAIMLAGIWYRHHEKMGVLDDAIANAKPKGGDA